MNLKYLKIRIQINQKKIKTKRKKLHKLQIQKIKIIALNGK